MGSHHNPANYNQAFAIGITLNIVFVCIEAFYGWQVNSLALLADAGHNLSDVAGLVLAWGGSLALKLKPNAKLTYGWKRATILAAFINALLLLIAMGGLGWEALSRLFSGNPMVQEQGVVIMVVASIGIAINALTALLFMRGRKSDLNIRAAFVHMTADALVSAGVLIAGALTVWLGWNWLDPLTSLAIALVILVGTLGIFRQSLHMMFDGVPYSIDSHAVHDCLASLPGVQCVQDLHIWAMGTTQVALTAHLIVPGTYPDDQFFKNAEELLHEKFEITHVTLQVNKQAFTESCCEGVYTKARL